MKNSTRYQYPVCGSQNSDARQRDASVCPLLFLSAGTPGPKRITSKVESTLAPAVGAGVRWHLNETWSLSAGIDFIALETDAEVRLLASDGTELGRSRTRLRFDPVNITLLAGYRF